MAKHPATYEVVVSNVGTVFTGMDFTAAEKEYLDYVQLSREERGRAGGETVTLMRDGEIEREYQPPRQEQDSCPDCGSTEFYATSYCNFVHCLSCGTAINPKHSECTGGGVIAMRLEMAHDANVAVEYLQGGMSRGRALEMLQDMRDEHPDWDWEED